jgi:hypothetical protein
MNWHNNRQTTSPSCCRAYVFLGCDSLRYVEVGTSVVHVMPSQDIDTHHIEDETDAIQESAGSDFSGKAVVGT